ncbi:MAG: exonuclease domain-containing protein [Verrucomicrobiota bacterium]
MNDGEPNEYVMSPRILVVDLETTGLDANKHSIVEMGAVWLTGGVGEFQMDCQMWEGAKWDDRAADVHGLSMARCTNPVLPTEGEAILELLNWCEATQDEPVMLAGLNPSFDRAFVLRACERAGVKVARAFRHRVLDLHSLAVAHGLSDVLEIPSRGLYTDEIYALLGLPAEPKPHRALVGARKEAEALSKIIGLV